MTLPFLKLRRAATKTTRSPRIYAIGDVHGRFDLFDRIVSLIKQDAESRPPRQIRLVILGDFVDRGPQSAQLITLLRQLRRHAQVIVLKGNHEAAMVDALDGDHSALDMWLAHGGVETLRSFGVAVDLLDLDDTAHVLRLARAAIPKPVRQWLRDLPTFVRFDRHYFVHAGIRPGVPLDDQTDANRLWIADEFTSSTADHGAVIVHGHTIHDEVFVGENRIAVDTGAYRSGRLSAVMIEDDEVNVLTATA